MRWVVSLIRVQFDVTCLIEKKISGIGVYTMSLYRALAKASVRQGNIELRPVIKLSRSLKKSHVQERIGNPGEVFWPVVDEWIGAKVFHGPDFRLITKTKRLKRVVTIHDLAVFHKGFNAERFRERGQAHLSDLLKRQQPDMVFVPSHSVKNEFLEKFSEYKDRVVAIHHGSDHIQMGDPKNVGARDPYFLFIGNIEFRKNLERVIKAFTLFHERHPDFKLLLVGQDGYGAEIIKKGIASSPVRDSIVRFDFMPLEQLGELYEKACGFVFPSLYEGFGIPVLEAMRRSCPLITSRFGALGEMAQSAALTVDPQSVEEIQFAMQKLAESESLRAKLVSDGLKQAQKFTWAKCASEVAKVYTEL